MEVVWLVDFDLPSVAVHLKDRVRRHVRQGRQHDDVSRRLQRVGLEIAALLGCHLAQLGLRLAGLFGALLDRADTNSEGAFVIAYPCRPIPRLADLELAQFGQQCQRSRFVVFQRHTDHVHAHDDIALMIDDVANAAPMRQSAIGHHDIVGFDGKASQRLALFRQRDEHLLTSQSAQVDHVVQSPRRPCGTGFTHHAGVDQAHSLARQHILGRGRQAQTHLLDHPPEPLAAAAQPTQQRHIGHLDQAARIGANGGLA
ncbi:MAG: hypothetical protein V9G98_21550 [Candidatus Competibacter sp.]